MDRTGFDPRYSPEFQRGFDPALHDGPSATAQTHERIGTVPAPPARWIPPIPTAGSDAGESVDRVSTENGMPGDAAAGDPDTVELPVSPWRNPYLIALTVLGVVLLGGGIAAFRWSVNQVYGGAMNAPGATQAEAEEAMLLSQLAWGLSPLLALAGVLTLLGVFFFAASRWRPQRRWGDDDVEEQPADGAERSVAG
ncbi:hypothetical protein D9V29_08250 [Mycetocola manganoxydans]|uniref:Uncharacterized protein n=1 Tax=Mycetocola manganoxydans TaxID=699879 RepID=A0A3L6ZTP3_9MICO|nr:hypothetical protein [Mycetocola manganoxydans]RLP71336.1 hypothetical protein D9V29_08250 [Mycetocola manganoxydans]GHD45867.1 hypothetical protein GCM10008097_15280 [Mycetocola manganoxydans]